MTRNRFLTPAQVAEVMGNSPETLRKWRCKGTGPAWHRFGRTIRYLESDVTAYITRTRSTPPPTPTTGKGTRPPRGRATSTTPPPPQAGAGARRGR